MAWKPTLVAKAQTPCWPWDLRDGRGLHPIGGFCALCGIDIAIPQGLDGFEPICLYCALENGVLPLEEIIHDDERTLHQIAMDERALKTRAA